MLSSLFQDALFAGAAPPVSTVPALAEVASGLQSVLEIPGRLELTIVKQNDHLVSAARCPEHAACYVISFEWSFLLTLSDDEIRAAIAHELGHIWIFTHHPYLQTEELANRIAVKAVSRTDLNHLYDKSQRYLAERNSATARLTE